MLGKRLSTLTANWCVPTISVAMLAALITATNLLPTFPRPAAGFASLPIRNTRWREIDDLPQPLAQFETVFWEPLDTESLRQAIRNADWLRGKSVLEIGTGTGLISLCCLQAGAAEVVATDVNAAAVSNAAHNANRLGMSNRLDVRLVPLERPQAFTVVKPDERFDLIVSNPPWENASPRSIQENALYDPNFQLLDSILKDGHRHLNPGGRIWLAYGSVDAIRRIQELAPQCHWQIKWLDDREMEELPQVFLPGLLLELTPISTSEP